MFLVKGNLTNAASIVQSSQPKRLFPTARATKRTVTVMTERLVRTAQIVIVLAALFWSPSGGGGPLSIRYADFLSSDTENDRGFLFESKLCHGVRTSIRTDLHSGSSWGVLPYLSPFLGLS